ncbi:biotin-dependent carboxyltransferase family protein [Patiriisocius hiemis]|uniref:Biotin-dependent carboxyltransferase family protein n=1 Tax=Patiriisocius hiemis TaxID=3075604 RepID=A0ABU2YA48_9FLAO|nr:biotin-dependent carboxyltransferase family protein [Constantimarinum sp. W242]MDT0555066.1 biotin-dependent carboxyltransferase family protein [Constantimarinum sp. W242]
MFKVLRVGIQTTIQDNGRFGYRKYGVPVSGCMDSYAATIANRILGNELSYPLIEFAMLGPKLLVLEPCTICITGPEVIATINGEALTTYKEVFLTKGATLDIKQVRGGMRGYIAVKGGISCRSVLESSSFYRELTSQNAILKDTIITPANKSKSVNKFLKHDTSYILSNKIEVSKGPEFDLLSKTTKEKLINWDFTISSQSNRMAILLETKKTIKGGQIISSPVQPGTVQLTPSGKLIVLMRDAQTTGGYYRILQLSENAINTISQKMPTSKIHILLK